MKKEKLQKAIRKAIRKKLAKYGVTEWEFIVIEMAILRELDNLKMPKDFPIPKSKMLQAYIDYSRDIFPDASQNNSNPKEFPYNSAGTSIEETGKSSDSQPKTKPKDEFMFNGPVITTDTKKRFASICNDETSNHVENCSGTEKQTSEDTSTMTVDGNNCPSKESIIKTVEEIINEMLYKAADNMDELRSILMNNTDAVYTNYIVKYFGFESITCYNASVAHTLDSHKQKDIMQIYGTVICQTSYTCNNSEFAIANRRKYKMGVFVCYNNKTDDYMVVVYTSNTPNVSGMHPYQPADLIMIIHRVLQVTRTADIWSQIRTVQLRAVKHVPTKEDIIADPTNPFGFTSSFEYTLASFRVTPVKDKDTDK